MQAAVVTGGGGGIGTAVALELARQGIAVVAMDPGVGLQGEPLHEPTAAQTARLIAAEGGVARASAASVTDREAVRALFGAVTREFGGLDIVVNTAGIVRFAPFLEASQDDWRAVLDVHLNGYLNVLAEALPLMAAAGHGRVVGVTSGAGLARAAADSAHYACAKRAVAAVTWQLAGLLPDGLALNALSPLAATRMVTGGRDRAASATASGRANGAGGTADGGPADARGAARGGAAGVDLSAMPAAADMAPAAAYLAASAPIRGQIIFSAGPELSVISPPRLLEAVRTADTADFAASLDTLVPVVLGPAEAQQRPTGGSNARFGPVFDSPSTSGPAPSGTDVHNCLVIADDAAMAGALADALARCGLTAVNIRPTQSPDFIEAERAVVRAAAGQIEAVVIAPGSFDASGYPNSPGPAASSAWQEMLDGYCGTAEAVLSHVGWLQAAVRQAVHASRPLRVMHLADATSPPRRPAAQAVAQLARCAGLLRPGQIDVLSIAVETAEQADHKPLAHLVARVLWSGDATALRGAELVARPGWIGIRSHPGPAATACYGTPAIPPWIGDWLANVCPRDAIAL
jgi:NAD(P)-dependent dehydrogenase (short-subunit alcohol dehydrogenase family)